MAKNVTFNGVEYKSPLAAAKVLVAEGKKPSEAVKILDEAGIKISPQSVYAYTSGAEKTNARRAKYRILSMGKTGKKTPSEIAERTGTSTNKVVAMLKKASITIVTKEALAKAESEKKEEQKTEKKQSKKTIKKSKKTNKKVQPQANEEMPKEVAELVEVMENIDN